MTAGRLAASVVLVVAAALQGCSTRYKEASDRDSVVASQVLQCNGAEQCSVYWRRAQLWVATNSRYPLVTNTDTLLITEPRYAEMWFGFTVTKEPQGGGREEIRMQPGCGNRFGCVSHPDTQIARFKRYVTGEISFP
jgi:hypothetical protein